MNLNLEILASHLFLAWFGMFFYFSIDTAPGFLKSKAKTWLGKQFYPIYSALLMVLVFWRFMADLSCAPEFLYGGF
jgi:membrane protein implicated in regulation of membrane protease activity